MKNVMLIGALLASSITFGQNIKAYKGLEFGMTKKEAKAEFKKNPEDYKSAKIGNALYRHYYQNNEYDKDGKLISIGFTIKGGGMFGVIELVASNALSDFIKVMEANGYKKIGPAVEGSLNSFKKDTDYVYISPEKDKTMTFRTISNSSDGGDGLVHVALFITKNGALTSSSDLATDDF